MPRALAAGPATVRGAVAGGLAGTAQEPEGDPSYAGRFAGAATGALTGAAFGRAGSAIFGRQQTPAAVASALNTLSATQRQALDWIITGLGGWAAHGVTHDWGMTLLAGYLMHRAGFGVRAIHALGPHVAQAAMRSAIGLQRGAAPAGAAVGRFVNATGPQQQ